MRYQLRDLFSDVIEAAKETGIWQTLTLDEKETLVEYFLGHFDTLMQEARWHKLSCLTTSFVTAGNTRRQAGGGQQG